MLLWNSKAPQILPVKKGHFIHWLYCSNKGEKTELELNAANTHSQQAAYLNISTVVQLLYTVNTKV